MKRLIVLILLSLFTSETSASENTEIPLTNLTGTYTINHRLGVDSKNEMVLLNRNPTEIHSVRVRLVGESFPSEYQCEFFPIIPAWRMDFRVTYHDSLTGGYFEAFFETSWEPFYDPPEVFTSEQEFIAYSNASWDLLKNGSGEIIFTAISQDIPYSIASCFYLCCPTATISEVTLIIDADYYVSTENSTWGIIKSIYNN